jgi:Protein chain release factor A
MINLDKQFSIILEKFKFFENSFSPMNGIDSSGFIKLNRDYSELRPIVEKFLGYHHLQMDIFILDELAAGYDFVISVIAGTGLIEKNILILVLVPGLF